MSMAMIDWFAGMDGQRKGVLSAFVHWMANQSGAGFLLYSFGFVVFTWQDVRKGWVVGAYEGQEAVTRLTWLREVASDAGFADVVVVLNELMGDLVALSKGGDAYGEHERGKAV
jgi:hypothetical protein